MVCQSGNLVIFVIAITSFGCSNGLQHRVGDSKWSIPPTKDFYTNWSSNRFFQIGDTLVFEFQSEFHNVMQVSRREFEGCTAENPFQVFLIGPATVPLVQQGVYYFICTFANYCVIGQKLSITVHHHSTMKSPPPLLSVLPSPETVLPPVPCVEDNLTKPPAQVSHLAPFPVEAVESPVSLMSKGSSAVYFTICRIFGVLVSMFLVLGFVV